MLRQLSVRGQPGQKPMPPQFAITTGEARMLAEATKRTLNR